MSPWLVEKSGSEYCVHKENPDGSAGEQVKCHPSEADAKAHVRALYSTMEDEAYKYQSIIAGITGTAAITHTHPFEIIAVKAVGDWELDVLAIPFHSRDSDGQWFDENTEIMAGAFETPLVLYQHGIKQGAKGLEGKPIVLGKAIPGTLSKQSDGWHIRVILNKAIKHAKEIMDAAYKKMVAVSSDSISHLARLEIGGKLIQYEKNKAGRIAVWPFAGVSLWELGNGNFRPANQLAFALPAMKAIYREAGLVFPEISDGDLQIRSDEPPVRRARIDAIKQKSNQILARASKEKHNE